MSKFERKFGKYAIKNLTLYLIIGYVIGYVLMYINPTIYSYITFDPYLIMKGQVWRIFTWILSAPQTLGIFTIIMLILYYSLGRSLEKTWGAYRYNVYLFLGFIFTVIGAMILYFVLVIIAKNNPSILPAEMISQSSGDINEVLGELVGGYTSTYYINMSIFLAFAATYPDMQLMLYFIIPVRVKWLGIVYGAFMLIDVAKAFSMDALIGIVVSVMIVVSLLNFLLYFFTKRKTIRLNPQQKAQRKRYKQSVKKAQHDQDMAKYAGGARHKCYVCGRTELDNPNLTFRYCSKCSDNKEYCEDHLFTHTHS